MFEQIVEFGLEGGVGLRGATFAFEGEDQRHQRFGDIAAADGAEMAARIRLIAQAVRSRGGVRAEGRRVGKAGVGRCGARWSPGHQKNKQKENTKRMKKKKHTQQ